MKKLRSIISLFLLVIACVFFKSCEGGPAKFVAFLIKVDSIRVPANINANIQFDIEFFGTIGTDGCYSFGDFYQTVSNNEILIEAWGNLDSEATVCPTVMVYLNGRKKSVTITTPGTYIIRIKQPRSTDILKQITVT